MIGKAVGGKGEYRYSFYFKRATNTNWKLLGEKFTDKASARFKPTAVGTYDIRIDVKDSSGTIVKKYFTASGIIFMETIINSLIGVWSEAPHSAIFGCSKSQIPIYSVFTLF